MEVSGRPLLVSVAAKLCFAPNSRLVVAGETPTAMSLTTVTCAVPFVEGSAELVAVTRTVVGAGKSAGAVYIPVAEIVPVAMLPPFAPFTLQITDALPAPVTVAENCKDVPSKTLPVGGVTEKIARAPSDPRSQFFTGGRV